MTTTLPITDPVALNASIFKVICDRAELDDRERFILDKHLGVSGERLTFADIGQRMGEIGWSTVARQRVHALRDEIKERIGPEGWSRLMQMYPEPVPESRIRKEQAKRRTAILKHLRAATESSDLHYEAVHKAAGVSIPHHRIGFTKQMDEVQSCYALTEDYGARNFGKYRYCTMCRQIKPSAGDLSEFYRIRKAGKEDETYIYQICVGCNTKRCVRFTRTKDGTINGRDAA